MGMRPEGGWQKEPHVYKGEVTGYDVRCYKEDGESNMACCFKHEAQADAFLTSLKARGTCKECGAYLYDEFFEPTRTEIRTRKLCFTCLFWTGKHEHRDDPNVVRVNGRHYCILPDDKPQSGFKGFGGARWHIRFFDGREVVSCNLWTQGIIPDRWRERLPDNAEFI